jgi:uncharacterized protein YgiM (DUF1202 family)
MSVLFLSSVILVNAVSPVCAADILYTQPFKAKIFTKPAMTSEALGQVDSGYQFESVGKEGSWIKLTYKGKTGYLPAVQAAKTPPLGKSSVQAVEMSPKLGARARTSSSSAVVAGMKGLTYEDRARVTKGERSDYESLDKIDQQKISAEELTQFQREGGKR